MGSMQQILSETPPLIAYVILFFTTLAENLFPPFPGDTITLISAYLVGIGVLDIWWTYGITTAGSLAGFLILYILGALVGRRYFSRKNFRYFSRQSIQRVEELFERRGVIIIALNRFLSGIRALISLVAGIAEYNWRVVVGLGVVSCILWNGALIYAGSRVGENWEIVSAWIQKYNAVALVIAGIALLVWGYFNLYVPAFADNNSAENS
ncbi:MAG: Protein DedA [Candidatus Marinimicrobia bacterium]|nr:Protein DedA [Candidatus Neomarinimicrobiota bacterium]